MPAGLSVAIALALAAAGGGAPANGQTYGPVLAPPAKPPPRVAAPKSTPSCKTAPPSADATEIVVCAERPQGYRLNPDVMTAKRQVRSQPQRRSNEHMKDTACASVGPAGCIAAPTINLLGAALVAATMARKVLSGENVGSMFVTRPEASEYELYVEARRRREAEEAAAAAKAQAPGAPPGSITTPTP